MVVTPAEPDPAAATAPAVDPPTAAMDPTAAPAAVQAEPSKSKPVVLATANHLTEFQVGDLLITHTGLPLSKTQAKEVQESADRHGVRLLDITQTEKG